MTREQLLKEKENLEYKLGLVNAALAESEKQPDADTDGPKRVVLDLAPWHGDILWQVADIIRTSPIVNRNYPWGYDCKICEECGNECSTDGDGIDCNWAFMEYFEKELKARGYYEGKG